MTRIRLPAPTDPIHPIETGPALASSAVAILLQLGVFLAFVAALCAIAEHVWG